MLVDDLRKEKEAEFKKWQTLAAWCILPYLNANRKKGKKAYTMNDLIPKDKSAKKRRKSDTELHSTALKLFGINA